MTAEPRVKSNPYAYTQNRELSWLRFNRRVLEEAADPSNPVMERLKFISIFSSNLDEFFMVRVGSLFDLSMVSPKAVDNKSGMTPARQLESVYQTIPGLVRLKKQIYTGVMKDLRDHDIEELSPGDLSGGDAKFINKYYKANLLPLLSPIITDSRHPMPHLVNKHLYIAVSLKGKKGDAPLGFIPIAPSIPPYVILNRSGLRYVRTESIILSRAADLFAPYKVLESCVISVTRNADISMDDEKFEDSEHDFRNKVTKLLKKRDNLMAIRLEIGNSVSEEFAARLRAAVGVDKRQTYIDTCPLNMKYVYQLAGDLSPEDANETLYRPYQGRWPEDLSPDRSIIDQVRLRDKMLFYPYDSVEPFLKLLGEAAERPDVLSVKITIYRMASTSKIARLLCRAAENGKQVTVLMELRARFDEANNVAWSKMLEEAGCQVIYGTEGFKCHCKICQITLRGAKGKPEYITQIGTGNYNEKTNTMYTDLSLMTASPAIGEDGSLFFRNMMINNLEGEYEELLVSPEGIKKGFCDLIDEEIKKGKEGYIRVKVNSVTEREIMDKLAEASRAGVEIHMVVRGICCLLPGVPGHTENIHITGIVGRFLEHARIYSFGRGDEAKYYIASADLMTRNLIRRVEIACPVHDPGLRAMLDRILDTQLGDNVKAAAIMPAGQYNRLRSHPDDARNSQQIFLEQTLHSAVPLPPVRPSLKSRFRNLFGK